MSVYRTLSAADLDTLRTAAGADAVPACTPIAAGIENSNWFVTLRQGGLDLQRVLTLLEPAGGSEEQLYFVLVLTAALARSGLPVPAPVPLADGALIFRLQDRPALLVPVLPGTHPAIPSAAQCRAAGAMLARLHTAPAAQNDPALAKPARVTDARWWPGAYRALAARMDAATHRELGAALAAASEVFSGVAELPHGIVHGDLFRDNVLMQGDAVSGVLDFHHATRDLLAWDLAIALNDWCVIDDRPDAGRAAAMIAGYESVRRLTPGENAVLPALRRAAAARFWLSRLERPGKDPAQMRDWLRALGA